MTQQKPHAIRVSVFCGARPGRDPLYRAEARRLADALVTRGIGLVYGGGRKGIMGALADAVLSRGGEVVGVIPEALLPRETPHAGLTRLHVVKSMHDRKALMSDLSLAFIALPGGYGTLDELFEALTWTQLGFHTKPCALLDTGGFFAHLVGMIDEMVARGFVTPAQRKLLLVDRDPDRLVEALWRYRSPRRKRRIGRESL